MKAEKLRVLIADDHLLVRQTVQQLIEKQPDMEVVATAATGSEVLESMEWARPDVIVMDVSMPELDGIQAIEQMRHDGISIAVVILSMFTDRALVRQAVQKGAVAYVYKQHAVRDLPKAIRIAAAGDYFFSTMVLEGDTINDPSLNS